MDREPDIVRKLDLGIIPEIGAPMPMLLESEWWTFLVFDAITDNPGGPSDPAGTAVLEFEHCIVSKFGYPNDEALSGHPLYERGLNQPYGCYEVLNPSWLEQIRAQNRISFPERTNISGRHFIVALHDSTFECLAHDMKLSLTVEPMGAVIAMITKEFIRKQYGPYASSWWSLPSFVEAMGGDAE